MKTFYIIMTVIMVIISFSISIQAITVYQKLDMIDKKCDDLGVQLDGLNTNVRNLVAPIDSLSLQIYNARLNFSHLQTVIHKEWVGIINSGRKE